MRIMQDKKNILRRHFGCFLCSSSPRLFPRSTLLISSIRRGNILEDLPPIIGQRLRSTHTVAMDAAMQRVLDEMAHMESRLNEAMTSRCASLEQRVDSTEQKMEARFISIEMDHAEVEIWKPTVEKRLDNLTVEMNRANKFMEREAFAHESTKPGIIPT